MKKATYISVFIGLLFLTISFIAFLFDQNFYNLLLPLGIGILLLISLPLFFIQLGNQSKKTRTRSKEHQTLKKPKKGSVKKTGEKSVPNYPSFSKRKSGLTWGGGNIHGSSATRGSKKGFLER